MKNSSEHNEAIDNIPLSLIMDEAVSAIPRIGYYRVRAHVEGHEQFTYGLVLCAAKGTTLYDRMVERETVKKTVPASQMRSRTIGETLRQAAGRMHDIGCMTTEPELYLLATINPTTIDLLESLMSDLKE